MNPLTPLGWLSELIDLVGYFFELFQAPKGASIEDRGRRAGLRLSGWILILGAVGAALYLAMEWKTPTRGSTGAIVFSLVALIILPIAGLRLFERADRR